MFEHVAIMMRNFVFVTGSLCILALNLMLKIDVIAPSIKSLVEVCWNSKQKQKHSSVPTARSQHVNQLSLVLPNLFSLLVFLQLLNKNTEMFSVC